jgi:outer membrane protein OmpA-like peptidoglycan-associated protein
MKHILAKAPALAALFVVACAGSQKNLTPPQQAAMEAEEQAQKAQDQAQKAREEANKTQQGLAEAQQAHHEASQTEAAANQNAEAASANAARAEREAGIAAPQSRPAAPPPPPKGVTEAQGPGQGKGEGMKEQAPSQTKLVVITSGLLFPSGSSDLSAAAKPQLDEIAQTLKAQPQSGTVIVQGHTDDVGNTAANLKLSAERAQSVANYLESQGISKDRVITKGVGERDPVSDKKTVEARAVNRRVDIMVQPAAGAAEQQGKQPEQNKQQQQQQQQQQNQNKQAPQQSP